MVRAAATLTVVAGFALAPAAALGATYYVDPATGNDSNAGTSQAAPWQTIPGTRTVSNSGWLRSAWGSITTANKLKPGDIIELKAGSTMSSAIGGRLHIDTSYYLDGTSTAPISIVVSPTWGTGHFTYDLSGVSPQQYFGSIHSLRNYIHIKGANSARRFVVRDANGWGVTSFGTSSAHQLGAVFDFLEIAASTGGGFDVSYSDNWVVSNSISHDNATLGFSVGGLNDQNARNGTFSDSTSYNNGRTDNGSGIRHGFGLYGATNITYIRCKAHNNGRDGFDFGTTSNSSNSSATVIDSSAHDNGEDGFGTNGGTSGTPQNLSTYINTVAFNNGQAGWDIYSGAQAWLYNCIAHHNGSQNGFGGNFMIYSEALITKVVMRNCIGYKPKSYANVYSYNSGGLPTTIDSNYNIWVPRSSNSEVFAETPFGSTHTYTNKPSWSGPNDKVGIAHAPNFISISTAGFAVNNYRLAAASGSAINAGIAITGVPAWTKDADGKVRTNPPEIGMYEYGSTAGVAPPTNLRIVP